MGHRFGSRRSEVSPTTERPSVKREEAPRQAVEATRQTQAPANTSLRVIPLGGVGEVGKNCTLLQYGRDLVLIDAGVKFPEGEMLGIDLIIPDTRYIREHLDQLRGIVITHGHEDHIGALAHVVISLGSTKPIPVYGSPLALGLAEARLTERNARHLVELRSVDPRKQLKLGGLQIEFIQVGHSIPDAYCVVIHSPVGPVVYTGDWKFAGMPEQSLARLRQLGDEGVTALLADCVRIESPGRTGPESVVTAALEEIVRKAPGRVIVTTFASNIDRVANLINSAHRLGRVSVLVGRSMERNLSVAEELGYIDVPDGSVIRADDMRRWKPEQLVLITTGSQGEPAAALSRIAVGEHRQIRITPGDTVVMAATPVPGNEESVGRTIDNLFRAGAEVLYPSVTPNIHVSGHAAREDHRELLQIVRPRYAAPFHGEYRMMVHYKRLAVEQGIPEENVLMPSLGDILDLGVQRSRIHGSVPHGSVLVDGLTVGTVNNVVLRDRRALAADGLLIASVVVERNTGRPVATPEIIARGLPAESEALLTGAQERVMRALQRLRRGEVEYRLLGDLIKESIGTYVHQQIGLRPMVLPVITEV
ncbi:MAG: Ribonuclease [Chloroflexi bacterium]|nr:Ribonuclease [Chloroflexota bacterium]